MVNCQAGAALSQQLPQLYHGLVPRKLLDFEIIETKANCANCSMARENRGPRAKITYKIDLKCCTFDPWVPNFAVGNILSDRNLSASVKEAILGKIDDIEQCSPLGLRPSTQFQRRFLRKDEMEFGNRKDWLCPFYNREQQNCGIWQHRGNVCVSFYCKSNAGQTGLRFWEELGDYLHLLELSLMEECLVQLDFSPRQMSDLLPLIDRQTHLQSKALPKITPQQSKIFWNGYSDPTEFFIKCAKIVKALKPKQVAEILGESGQRAWGRLEARMHQLP